MIEVREESAADRTEVREVVAAAFGRDDEADLVEALREAGAAVISLVAVADDRVVGHILFSPVTIEPDDESAIESFTALGLAPLAVAPDEQRRGIGAALTQAGLELCRRLGHDAVFVLGHPEYYPRFGFAPAGEQGLRCEYDVPPEVFMVAELRPGALGDLRGLVKYHPAFGGF